MTSKNTIAGIVCIIIFHTKKTLIYNFNYFMKKYLLLAITIFFYSCNNTAQIVDTTINNQDHEKSKITKKQSDIIFKHAKTFPNETQVSIALIENGVPKYYGIKKVNDTIISIENYKNVFEIGSITKVFTATLLAGLVHDNKIELNDDINQYLKFPLKNKQKITFKELANHTSGLPGMPTNFDTDITNPNPIKNLDNKVLKAYLTSELELSHKTLTKYRYSNLGAGLLGYTLSEITNTDYATLLQNNIFSKYGMTKSVIGTEKIKSLLVQGLSPKGNPVQNWELGALAGAGAIISSVEDLSKFAIAQFNKKNKELELTRRRTYWVNFKDHVALGWHIKKGFLKDDLYWHNGGTGGYSSCITLNTNTQNSVIVLTNISTFSQNTEKVDDICFKLMKTLEGN